MLLPVALFMAATTVASPPQDRGRELVEDVCSYCHNLDRLRGKEFSREEWQGLIKGMISEGPPVTDEEFSTILDYLVKHHGRKPSQEPR
ncbi:MAG: c-type cytochrome [Bryobacteraceae bacterium]